MSFGTCQLKFPIDKKSKNFVRNHHDHLFDLRTIYVLFGFNKNFNYQKIFFPFSYKVLAKFSLILSCGFRGTDFNVKVYNIRDAKLK